MFYKPTHGKAVYNSKLIEKFGHQQQFTT